MNKPKDGRRNVCVNRKARHEFELGESFEAGIVLVGSETKSLRAGKGNLDDAWVRVEGGEAWLMGAHIGPYPQAGQFNHEATRPRKLLLHNSEIARLQQRIRERGLAVIPLQMYFKGPWCKVEIAVGRGKKLHDKREALKEAQDKREVARAMRGR